MGTSIDMVMMDTPSSPDISPPSPNSCAKYLPEIETEKWSVVEFGKSGTLRYRMLFLDKQSRPLSMWHNLPLYIGDGHLNFICMTPRGSWLHFEAAQNEEFNPLRLCRRGNAPLRFAENCNWNYGMLPQTWADPDQPVSDFPGYRYDGKPVEVFEIGSRPSISGKVYPVKPVTAFAVLSEETKRVSWKIVAIAHDDFMSADINNAEDVDKYLPGTLGEIREWLRTCVCTHPDDKESTFGLDDMPADTGVAAFAVAESHASWQLYADQQTPPEPWLARARPIKPETLESLWVKYTNSESEASITMADTVEGNKVYRRGTPSLEFPELDNPIPASVSPVSDHPPPLSQTSPSHPKAQTKKPKLLSLLRPKKSKKKDLSKSSIDVNTPQQSSETTQALTKNTDEAKEYHHTSTPSNASSFLSHNSFSESVDSEAGWNYGLVKDNIDTYSESEFKISFTAPQPLESKSDSDEVDRSISEPEKEVEDVEMVGLRGQPEGNEPVDKTPKTDLEGARDVDTPSEFVPPTVPNKAEEPNIDVSVIEKEILDHSDKVIEEEDKQENETSLVSQNHGIVLALEDDKSALIGTSYVAEAYGEQGISIAEDAEAMLYEERSYYTHDDEVISTPVQDKSLELGSTYEYGDYVEEGYANDMLIAEDVGSLYGPEGNPISEAIDFAHYDDATTLIVPLKGEDDSDYNFRRSSSRKSYDSHQSYSNISEAEWVSDEEEEVDSDCYIKSRLEQYSRSKTILNRNSDYSNPEPEEGTPPEPGSLDTFTRSYTEPTARKGGKSSSMFGSGIFAAKSVNRTKIHSQVKDEIDSFKAAEAHWEAALKQLSVTMGRKVTLELSKEDQMLLDVIEQPIREAADEKRERTAHEFSSPSRSYHPKTHSDSRASPQPKQLRYGAGVRSNVSLEKNNFVRNEYGRNFQLRTDSMEETVF